MPDRPDIDTGHSTLARVAMLGDRATDDLTRRLATSSFPRLSREVVQPFYDVLDATAQVRTYSPVLAEGPLIEVPV